MTQQETLRSSKAWTPSTSVWCSTVVSLLSIANKCCKQVDALQTPLLSDSIHYNTRSLNCLLYLSKSLPLSIKFTLISVSTASLHSFKALQTLYSSLCVNTWRQFFSLLVPNKRNRFTLQGCSFSWLWGRVWRSCLYFLLVFPTEVLYI